MLTSPITVKRQPGIIVMGVSGTGKSLIAQSLVNRLNKAKFLEGDDFHPVENIESMTAGIPLTDQHRENWLNIIGRNVETSRLTQLTVCSCSALKKRYREQLRALSPGLIFIYLAGDKSLIEQRMMARKHFMPASLLDSQLNTLEPPEPNKEENIITCDIRLQPEEIINGLIAEYLPPWIASTQIIEVKND